MVRQGSDGKARLDSETGQSISRLGEFGPVLGQLLEGVVTMTSESPHEPC
jgi:hypothetical protein